MSKQRRVFLYGRSVILGTVAASLKHYSDLDIALLSPPFPEVRELEALTPDVIIYDLQADQPEAALTLLDTCPNLMLIGIDPSSNQVFLWAGKHMKALSAQDLVQAIRNHAAIPDEDHPENSNH
jgi:hypothetical protein